MISEPMLPLAFARQKMKSREKISTYTAVVALRRAGHQVYRAGDMHKVDGNLCDRLQLVALARTIRSNHDATTIEP